MNRCSFFDRVVEKPVIVGAGFIALDVVLGSSQHDHWRMWAGGTCGNVLAILSFLDWQSFPVARLNGDAASDHVRRDLLSCGVRLDFANSEPSTSVPILIQYIHHDHEGRGLHKFSRTCPVCGTWLPTYKPITTTTAREIAAQIQAPKVFFMDRVSRGSLILARASAERGALIVFEPSSIGDPRLFAEALSVAHILKYSGQRIADISHDNRGEHPLLEIQTLGDNGLRFRSRIPSCRTASWHMLAAHKVDRLRDTAGAGDWCTAGILHALGQSGVEGLRHLSMDRLQEGLSFGQALGAWNCRFEGARGGMYHVDKMTLQGEVEQIMGGGRSNTSPRDDIKAVAGDIFRTICTTCAQKPEAAFCAID